MYVFQPKIEQEYLERKKGEPIKKFKGRNLEPTNWLLYLRTNERGWKENNSKNEYKTRQDNNKN